ncbi:hypothetical protein P389DRAFT_174768 [Cystobasidium minutum MCA 4210]|uniref:uncharacterized protein n=1 Tax=Cystobasidium minutum MCA 4210 TaxID=1397322 RepID=UPI0034CEDA3A|eukprot:jgi/Rhomi1/174768/fgenesh1_kg.8_\
MHGRIKSFNNNAITLMNTSNIAAHGSQVKESSKHVLAYLPPLLGTVIWKPLKFLCLRALPLTVSYLYISIAYVLYYLTTMLRWCLMPVLFPLELFIWKPFMTVVTLVYQLRYLIYFTTSAILLGCLFGLASYWISSSSRRNTEDYKPLSAPALEALKPKTDNTRSRSPTPRLQASLSSASSRKAPITDPNTTSSDRGKAGKSDSNKMQPPAFAVKEEIIIESPKLYDSKPLQPVSKASSPGISKKMEDGQDKDGRDRFEEAMKALARQRKQARLATAR